MTKRDELIEVMERAYNNCKLGPTEWMPYTLTALEAHLGIDLTAIAEGRSVAVPVEPTEGMKQNAAMQAMMTDWEDTTEDERVDIITIYRAMIAAAKE